LEIVPFESFDTVSYSHSIVTMVVCLAVSAQYTTWYTSSQPDTARQQEPRYAASLGCSRAVKMNRCEGSNSYGFSFFVISVPEGLETSLKRHLHCIENLSRKNMSNLHLWAAFWICHWYPLSSLFTLYSPELIIVPHQLIWS